MGTFDFSRADLIATAPSWGAVTVKKEPLNYPVRIAIQIGARITRYLCGWGS